MWYCTGSDFHVKLVYCGTSKNTDAGFCEQANEHKGCIGGNSYLMKIFRLGYSPQRIQWRPEILRIEKA